MKACCNAQNVNILTTNPTKRSNNSTNSLSVSDQFVGLMLKELINNLSAYNFHNEAVLLHHFANLNLDLFREILSWVNQCSLVVQTSSNNASGTFSSINAVLFMVRFLIYPMQTIVCKLNRHIIRTSSL